MPLKAALAWSLGDAVAAVRARRLPTTGKGRALLAVVLAAVLAGVGGLAWVQLHRLPDGAAFAVGDRVVTVDELDRRVETLRALYGVTPPLDDPVRMDAFRRDAAKAVAVALILDGEAAEMQIGVADTKVRETLSQYIVAQFGAGPGAYDEFVRVLGNVGATEQTVLDEIRQQLAVAEMYNAVTGDVRVDEEQARAAFPQYADRLGVPEQRVLRNIVVTTEQQAADLAQQARGGADFAALARTFSIDGSSRDKGGELGSVTAAQLLPQYAQAAFSTPAGQVFGPLQNEFGWNVGQVVSVTPGQPAQLEAALPQLTQLVTFDRKNETWREWLGAAIADADVDYAEDYRPADPLGVPAATGPGVPRQPAPAQPPVPAPPAPQPR